MAAMLTAATVFGGSFVIVMLMILFEVRSELPDDVQSTASKRSPTIPKRGREVSGAEEAMARHLLRRPMADDLRSRAAPG